MINPLIVQITRKGHQFPQHVLDELPSYNNGRVIIQQLFHRDIVPHFNGYGINTVIPFVGHEMELFFLFDTCQGIVLILHALLEKDVIGQLVVKLHEIGILAVYQPLVEITIRQTHLSRLTGITRLYQLLKIHRYVCILIDFVGQKYA